MADHYARRHTRRQNVKKSRLLYYSENYRPRSAGDKLLLGLLIVVAVTVFVVIGRDNKDSPDEPYREQGVIFDYSDINYVGSGRNNANIQKHGKDKIWNNVSETSKDIGQDSTAVLPGADDHVTALGERHCRPGVGVPPSCPVTPLHLVGRQAVVRNSSSAHAHNVATASGVRPGGQWSPPHCSPRYTVAIIVPVRDREEQMWSFLSHMHPFLQRQELNYTIYVVEQGGAELFNRGKLLNIGFVETASEGPFDCVAFHDVDMLPEDDRHLYHCSAQVRHLVVAASNNKYKSNLSFMRNRYFGGACLMSPRHIKGVNGWSNRYWGWGGEDDDMWRRVAMYDLPVWRYPAHVARYTMLEHGPPPGVNRHSYQDLARFSPHFRSDGLNSLHYAVLQRRTTDTHTHLLVDVRRPEDDPPLPPLQRRGGTESRQRLHRKHANGGS